MQQRCSEPVASDPQRRIHFMNCPILLAASSLIALGVGLALPLDADTRADELETSYDGLQRLERSVMDEVYLRPDLDLRSYTSVMIDRVSVAYKRQPPPPAASMRATGSRSNFALTDRQMEELENIFNESFVRALTKGEGWQITDSPGPHVLRLQPELIDLVVKVPTRQGAARTDFFVSEIGEVTLVIELRDSETREILARGVDRSVIRSGGSDRLSYTTAVSA